MLRNWDLNLLCTKIKLDNNLFWSYVRFTSKGQISSSELETACILNQDFASVFEVQGDQELPDFQTRPYTSTLEVNKSTQELIQSDPHQVKGKQIQLNSQKRTDGKQSWQLFPKKRWQLVTQT